MSKFIVLIISAPAYDSLGQKIGFDNDRYVLADCEGYISASLHTHYDKCFSPGTITYDTAEQAKGAFDEWKKNGCGPWYVKPKEWYVAEVEEYYEPVLKGYKFKGEET